MIRTQISLDERAYREAKSQAKRDGISLAEFLRRAIPESRHDELVWSVTLTALKPSMPEGDTHGA